MPLRDPSSLSAKPGAWGDLLLTLPVFLVYELGVVFLNVRNATDVVTERLLDLAHGDRLTYLEITAAIGLGTALVFAILGRGQAFRPRKLLQTCFEGAVYATAMGTAASWVVGRLFAGVHHGLAPPGPTASVVMSFGAGFYEELAFRAVLFGGGTRLLLWLLGGSVVAQGAGGPSPTLGRIAVTLFWALGSAAIFSGMHYFGALGDPFDMRTFVARGVLGLALTLVYVLRGFAAAVWTHALYDVWVLAL
ncbi:MAG: CPBP family glutamic-type intramembrane protease [Polyangiaceae bacterium]|jgi:hypothetical protein